MFSPQNMLTYALSIDCRKSHLRALCRSARSLCLLARCWWRGMTGITLWHCMQIDPHVFKVPENVAQIQASDTQSLLNIELRIENLVLGKSFANKKSNVRPFSAQFVPSLLRNLGKCPFLHWSQSCLLLLSLLEMAAQLQEPTISFSAKYSRIMQKHYF